MLWDLTQRRMIVPYRRFGTTYPSHIQGSSSPKDCLTLVDGTDSLSRNVCTDFIVSSIEFPTWIFANFRLSATLYSMQILQAVSQHIWRVSFCNGKMRLGLVEGLRGKAVPLQAWSGPEVSRNLRFPYFMRTAQDGGKIVSLTHRPPLPPGNTPGTNFCQRLSRPQGHSATGRIVTEKFQ